VFLGDLWMCVSSELSPVYDYVCFLGTDGCVFHRDLSPVYVCFGCFAWPCVCVFHGDLSPVYVCFIGTCHLCMCVS